MRRLELGRVVGIPISVDAGWLIVLSLVTWTLATRYFPGQIASLTPAAYWGIGLAAAVLLFLCVLLHELGHSLVARLAGIPVSRITLFIFGGVAHIASESRRPLVELSVALAGPVVSAGLGGLCRWGAGLISPQTPPALAGVAILRYLAVVNMAILVFNLLPGFPLDGGRVLRAVLWAVMGDLRKATRIASALGSALGLGLIVLGAYAIFRGGALNGLWYVLLGWFLRDAAHASYQDVLLRQFPPQRVGGPAA